ncbi:pyrimidine-nucleoside phosphorylase [Carnobacterium gallinarum]|uniref:hypothetical protein n=1 Tax=Carnobacterium gallinarum TaxID=2749 RepID=UPI0005585964|nr:hypothetical protein [Carnobacterium gallinarum]
MLKKIVYGSWFVSLLYFAFYLISPFLSEAVAAGGLIVYVHVLMDFIFIGGLFFIIVSILRYLFIAPKK